MADSKVEELAAVTAHDVAATEPAKPLPPLKDKDALPATPSATTTERVTGSDKAMPHPAVLEHAPAHVAAAQVEKHAAAERELKGHPPKGTIVLGLEDEKLWAMRRRFDTSVLHILSPPTNLPKGEPDLRPSTLPNVPFSQDELRSNLERAYAHFAVNGSALVHHMSRLMWWQEGERTRSAAFAVGYFTACIFNLALPFILVILILLTVSPKARYVMFPAAKPKAHSLPDAMPATKEHKTTPLGIPTEEAGEQLSKAEQAEQHAFEMTNIVQRFGVRVLVGGKQKSTGNAGVGRKRSAESMPSGFDSSSSESTAEEKEADLGPAQDAIEAKQDEHALTPKEQKMKARAEKKRIAREAKIKRDALVGQIAKQLQDVFGAIADMVEVINNALNPPAGFPSSAPRLRLAGAIFVPVLLVTAVVPAHWYAKGASFGAGIAFFGQPVLRRLATFSLHQLDKYVPDWKQRVDPRNSILSGVPTDNQVMIHLLRQSERAFHPLPPAPKWPADGSIHSDIQVDSVDPTSMDSDTAHAEAGIHPDEAGEEEGAPEDEQTREHRGLTKMAGKKALAGLRGVAKRAATFRGDVEITAPVKPAKNDNGDDRTLQQKTFDKVDELFIRSKAKDEGSVDRYPAKLNNNSGYLTIEVRRSGEPATLTFYPLKKPDTPTFHQRVEDLVEIKKVGVWVGRAVLGWAAAVQLEGRGLVMRFKSPVQRANDSFGKGYGDEKHEEEHEGDVYTFTQVERRDQMFARLLAVGGQKWETL